MWTWAGESYWLSSSAMKEKQRELVTESDGGIHYELPLSLSGALSVWQLTPGSMPGPSAYGCVAGVAPEFRLR